MATNEQLLYQLIGKKITHPVDDLEKQANRGNEQSTIFFYTIQDIARFLVNEDYETALIAINELKKETQKIKKARRAQTSTQPGNDK